ncbi:MAG: class I SAM-dependent methyltransferase [Candidatus Omnitrophica bacterium]|nr:class I SAM-dependent methyltransferase [Candidatus Omnitrophota bacterium]
MNAGSEVIHRACPLDGGTDAEPFMRKGGLELVRCRRCGMVYADPVAADLASGVFYDRTEANYYLSPDKLESDYSPVRFERELRLLRKYCPRGAVLDVGCSTGAFLHQLNSRFPGDYRGVGTDVAGAALDHAEGQGIEVIRESFLEFDFGQRRFDAVTFWAVLEHVIDPVRFFDRAAGLLAPGGYCFALVPNLKSLAVRLLGTKYRYIMPDHMNYFAAKTLAHLAQTAGTLEIVALLSTHFNPLVLLYDWRGGDARVPDEARARLLKRTTAYKQNSWLKPLKTFYGAMESILGRLHLADNLVLVVRKL